MYGTMGTCLRNIVDAEASAPYLPRERTLWVQSRNDAGVRGEGGGLMSMWKTLTLTLSQRARGSDLSSLRGADNPSLSGEPRIPLSLWADDNPSLCRGLAREGFCIALAENPQALTLFQSPIPLLDLAFSRHC